MAKPLISVIVTTKNESANIERLLKSIKQQTYPKIEIIVVDNNSSDNTVKIAKRYTSKVFNIGPERSTQRNLGAKKSKGDYLLFLDADMELTKKVVESCVDKIQNSNVVAVTIAETTVGENFISKVRKFEREMYMGEPAFEVARFFDRKTFFEFGGYDTNLTGPEDYDLPFRISKKYTIGRVNSYIYHHEEAATFVSLLRKKFYYAASGASYAQKHPKLIWVQGTILFRKTYLKNWKKFIKNPVIGAAFLFVRFFEMVWAFAGFVKSVGIKKVFSIVLKSFND